MCADGYVMYKQQLTLGSSLHLFFPSKRMSSAFESDLKSSPYFFWAKFSTHKKRFIPYNMVISLTGLSKTGTGSCGITVRNMLWSPRKATLWFAKCQLSAYPHASFGQWHRLFNSFLLLQEKSSHEVRERRGRCEKNAARGPAGAQEMDIRQHSLRTKKTQANARGYVGYDGAGGRLRLQIRWCGWNLPSVGSKADFLVRHFPQQNLSFCTPCDASLQRIDVCTPPLIKQSLIPVTFFLHLMNTDLCARRGE